MSDVLTSGKDSGQTKGAPTVGAAQEETLYLSFGNNSLLPMLFGEHDSNVQLMEKLLGVQVSHRGGQVAISGGEAIDRQAAYSVLENIYAKLESGQPAGRKEMEAAIRMVSVTANRDNGGERLKHNSTIQIKTRKKTISPYSNRQADYLRCLLDYEVAFALGPAGTGKTYLAVAVAVSLFIDGKVDRIILSRPAVEAGEKLGYLPGDLKDKIDPYLRPLYDALHDMLPAEKVLEYMENGTIEIAPLAFMRGRTLSNAFVILDEAQNSSAVQMKMFLTRLGEGSRMCITGDLSQVDLPTGQKSGLRDAMEKLDGVDGIGFTKFGDKDVVRHELAARIVRAYEKHEQPELPLKTEAEKK